MVILDLEWNGGYSGKVLEEILQIGAVRVETLGGPITDTFNVFIHPAVHKSFSPGARKLPELEQSQCSDTDFPAALEAFLRWCGEETEFASWGGDDFKVLSRNCAYYELPVPQLKQPYDLQGAFARALGAGKAQIALHRAVAYCAIPESFTFHNALNDAMYTALVSAWIPAEALVCVPERPPRRKRSFSSLPFAPQPRCRTAPLPAPEDVLNNKKARCLVCPICQKPVWITRWFGPVGQQYYAPFRCPVHGRFLCRLTLTRTESGAWRGRRSVPALSPETVAEYQRAASAGSYVCKGSRHKKKKYRWLYLHKAASQSAPQAKNAAP